jgi:MFS superfamily sulfate permease-like transporter
VGQGIANILSPLFGGLPATGAIARTATNIRSKTSVAEMIHSLTLSYVGVFRIHGPFLFGATDKLDAIVSRLHDLPPIIILRLRNMTAIDSTGFQALEKFADQVHESGRQLILCGAREQPAKRMREAGFHGHLGPQNVCLKVADALDRAKNIRPERSEPHPQSTSLDRKSNDISVDRD